MIAAPTAMITPEGVDRLAAYWPGCCQPGCCHIGCCHGSCRSEPCCSGAWYWVLIRDLRLLVVPSGWIRCLFQRTYPLSVPPRSKSLEELPSSPPQHEGGVLSRCQPAGCGPRGS